MRINVWGRLIKGCRGAIYSARDETHGNHLFAGVAVWVVLQIFDCRHVSSPSQCIAPLQAAVGQRLEAAHPGSPLIPSRSQRLEAAHPGPHKTTAAARGSLLLGIFLGGLFVYQFEVVEIHGGRTACKVVAIERCRGNYCDIYSLDIGAVVCYRYVEFDHCIAGC